MRRKKIAIGERGVKIALLFFCIIGLLIGAGVTLKLYLIFSAAKFDGAHQFILEVDGNSQKGKIIDFSPDTQTATVLNLSGSHSGDFGSYLGIPTDSVVSVSEDDDIAQLTKYLLLHTPSNLNRIDAIRLFLFAYSIKPTQVNTKTITLPVDSATSEVILPQLFTDKTMFAENRSIAVVNATGVTGIGNRVAKMITTIGGNVISVTTADKPTTTSSLVYADKSGYTVGRMSKLFRVSTSQSNQAMLSDITLTIGSDMLGRVQ